MIILNSWHRSACMPFMNTIAYNQAETVIFQNKSKRIMFYDKESQCHSEKCPLSISEKAKGILRLEISTPDYDMRKYEEFAMYSCIPNF